jgi:arylsulfatase A-like enzyme
LPSPASLVTGRLPNETGTDWFAPLDRRWPTLAERLRDAGYLTAGFVANTRYCSAEVGMARGCVHYEDHTFGAEEFLLCAAAGREFLSSFLSTRLGCCDMPARKSAADVNRGLLCWLDRQDDRPFFAFVNYLDAHDPYIAPSPFGEGLPDDYHDRLMLRFWWWMHKSDLKPGQSHWLRERYAQCVESLDRQIGDLIEQLRLRGRLANTLIVITADHGEHFGEHGLYLHGNSLYEPLVHVPLLVVWPGHVPAGRRVRTPVSLVDLPATVLELAAEDSAEHLPGTSLEPLWSNADESAAKRVIVTEVLTPPVVPPCQGRSPVFGGSSRAVRLGDFKYIRHADGREELYDLGTDPSESLNLAAEPSAPHGRAHDAAAHGDAASDAEAREMLDELRAYSNRLFSAAPERAG